MRLIDTILGRRLENDARIRNQTFSSGNEIPNDKEVITVDPNELNQGPSPRPPIIFENGH